MTWYCYIQICKPNFLEKSSSDMLFRERGGGGKQGEVCLVWQGEMFVLFWLFSLCFKINWHLSMFWMRFLLTPVCCKLVPGYSLDQQNQMKWECPGCIATLGQDRLLVAVAWLRTLTRACNYSSCRDRNVPNLHLEKPSIKQKNYVTHVQEYAQRWRKVNAWTFIML